MPNCGCAIISRSQQTCLECGGQIHTRTANAACRNALLFEPECGAGTHRFSETRRTRKLSLTMLQPQNVKVCFELKVQRTSAHSASRLLLVDEATVFRQRGDTLVG